MKRLVVVSALVGFAVPIFWGVMAFLTFGDPQNALADMFWATVHRTCPPWLIDGTSILANSLATPFLNAALYGSVAFMAASVFRGISRLIHIRLALGSIRIYGVIAMAGLCAVVAASLSVDGRWALVGLPAGAWLPIGSAITYFSMDGQRRVSAET